MFPNHLSENLGIVICIFFSALAILHILMHFSFPQTKRFWKSTDYAWLTVAAFGLVGVTQKAREDHVRVATLRSAEALRVLRDTAHRMPDFWKQLEANLPDIGPPDAIQQGRTAIQAVQRWNAQLIELLNKDLRPGQIANSLIDFQNNSSDRLEAGGFLMKFGDSLELAIEADREVRDSSARSSLELLFIDLSPFLLATAIAIRMTKVSAELFGYDQAAQTSWQEFWRKQRSFSINKIGVFLGAVLMMCGVFLTWLAWDTLKASTASWLVGQPAKGAHPSATWKEMAYIYGLPLCIALSAIVVFVIGLYLCRVRRRANQTK